MAAPVRGHNHSIAGVPRQMAVLHTREGCDGQRSGVTAVVLPLAGLRVGVLHLQFLLPGASLLRGQVPKESKAGTAAAGQPATPAKPGGTARSPRPPAGLPGTLPTPPRDGSYFRRARASIRSSIVAAEPSRSENGIGARRLRRRLDMPRSAPNLSGSPSAICGRFACCAGRGGRKSA